MKRPRKAIILAAGFGSRLAPITLDCPKPLIPVKGKAMIQRVMEQLKSWGVKEVLVNLHHGADHMLTALPQLVPQGLTLTISHEPEILGTGGGLRRMDWFFDPTDPLWVCNADVVQDVDPAPLIRAYHKEHPLACLWMIPDHGPRTVTVKNQRVTDFRGGGMTFSGLHLLSPGVLDILPEEEGFSSIITAYETAMRSGKTVLGITVPGSRWEDAGTPERLLKANKGSVVCPGAVVEEGVTLDDAVVGPGTRIRKGTQVSGLVVSPPRILTPAEQQFLPEAEAVECLPLRGSDRDFFRVHHPKGSHILIRSGDERPENIRTVSHFRFLKRNGIRVPEIYRASTDGKTIWMEDAGRVHLLDRLQSGSERRNKSDMKKVLELTARFHRLNIPSRMKLEPSFTPALFRWEHDLFIREFLKRADPEVDIPAITRDLRRVARRLQNLPQGLVHRDLQSTNFLWHRHAPVMIDVQGMRMGPIVYDLASLLADPYVGRTREEQLRLLNQYPIPISEEAYAAGATQRLVQALGAYGRLGSRPETRRFLSFIPEAVRQLTFWATEPALSRWANEFFMRHPDQNSLDSNFPCS